MALADIAPRLGKAHAQMVEIERVLGWVRDHDWTGGFDVLVPITGYVGLLHDRNKPQWVKVERVVQGDAAPYPIRGHLDACDYTGSFKAGGQWAFWEVQDIRFWQDSPPHPRFAASYPDFPYPLETT